MSNQGIKQVNTKLVISELHRAFKLFNEELFQGQLPEPAILIQSRGNKKLTLGWCTVGKVWKNEFTQEERYEINLVAEALNRGTLPVMATLLHEMVHLHNLVNEIKDTSRGNTYHNMKFKNTAEAHGLIIEHAEKIGWSVTTLQDETVELIKSAHFDEAVFSLGRKDSSAGDTEKKKKKTSSRKYICPECGTTIRASKDVFVLCGLCTNLVEGKVVPMIKEQPEDEEDTPTAETIEKVCNDCGCISEVPEEASECPECSGELIIPQPKEEPTEAPAEPTEEEPIEEEVIEAPVEKPVEIVEVDTVLIDGDGNPVPVKQGMINIKRVWTPEAIESILKEAQEQAEALGLQAPAFDLPIEINPKMISQYALYKEGKNLTFSKNYLAEASAEDIIDTIKHQYLHHYEFIVEGLKVNHKKPFKALCEQFGLDTKVPVKNHRAMK